MPVIKASQRSDWGLNAANLIVNEDDALGAASEGALSSQDADRTRPPAVSTHVFLKLI